MVSAWWLPLAFFAGGFSGVLVMALMYLAADRAESPAAGRARDAAAQPAAPSSLVGHSAS